MTVKLTIIKKILLPTALVLLVGACGGTDGSGSGTGDGYGAKPGSEDTAKVTLTVKDNPQLGQILVDGQGRTLYRFDEDTASPSKSNCTGDCAAAWPPLVVEGKIRTSGVDQSKVGSIERPDGTRQVTFAGWPMYLYVNDRAPGDVKGQEVQDLWYAVTPTGAKAGENATEQEDSKPDEDDDGYGY